MPQGFTPSFEPVPCELLLVRVEKKMSERKSLSCLSSYVNVNGEEAVGRRVRAERTTLDRIALRMAERREETWRPLNRKRTSTFVRLFLTAMVDKQNAFRSDQQKKSIEKMLIQALVKRVIPFVYRNRVWTLDENMWPISLAEFRGLNDQLDAKLPKIHASHHWQSIVIFTRRSNGSRRNGNGWRKWRGLPWSQ